MPSQLCSRGLVAPMAVGAPSRRRAGSGGRQLAWIARLAASISVGASALTLAPGCRPSAVRAPLPPAATPPALSVARIVVDLVPGWPEPGDAAADGLAQDEADRPFLPDAASLRAQMVGVLGGDPSVKLAPDDPHGATVMLLLQPGHEGLALELRLEAPAPAPIWAATVPLASVGLGDVPDAGLAGQTATARAAMVAAWARLDGMRRLQSATSEALIVALSDPDPQVGGAAVELLAQRQHRPAVGPICARLRQAADPGWTLRGMGALVALGDEGAVPTLIDLTLHQEAPFLVQSAFAIGALGGPLAEAYLVTVGSGHPDPEVARAARDALQGPE